MCVRAGACLHALCRFLGEEDVVGWGRSLGARRRGGVGQGLGDWSPLALVFKLSVLMPWEMTNKDDELSYVIYRTLSRISRLKL
jgi:hypothetical protein